MHYIFKVTNPNSEFPNFKRSGISVKLKNFIAELPGYIWI